MQAREQLELSLMEHAELVFTTLSSTGRALFGRIKRRHFDAVLIDEACQAAEVATLQPLVHGTKKVGGRDMDIVLVPYWLMPRKGI